MADAPLDWVSMVNSLYFGSSLFDGLSVMGDGLSITHKIGSVERSGGLGLRKFW